METIITLTVAQLYFSIGLVVGIIVYERSLFEYTDYDKHHPKGDDFGASFLFSSLAVLTWPIALLYFVLSIFGSVCHAVSDMLDDPSNRP